MKLILLSPILLIFFFIGTKNALATNQCTVEEKPLGSGADAPEIDDGSSVSASRLDVTTADGKKIVVFGWTHGGAFAELASHLQKVKNGLSDGSYDCAKAAYKLSWFSQYFMTNETYLQGRAIHAQVAALNQTHKINFLNLELSPHRRDTKDIQPSEQNLAYIRQKCPQQTADDQILYREGAIESHLLSPANSLITNGSLNVSVRQIDDDRLIANFVSSDNVIGNRANRILSRAQDLGQIESPKDWSDLQHPALMHFNLGSRKKMRTKFTSSEINQILSATTDPDIRGLSKELMYGVNQWIDDINARDKDYVQKMRNASGNQVFIVGSAHISGIRKILDSVCRGNDFYRSFGFENHDDASAESSIQQQ